MKRMSDEFDVLFRSVDPVEAELARAVLESAGIPSMMHGQDFDVAELGVAAHAVVRRRDLLVPRGTRTNARAVIVDAWGESRVAELEEI